MRTVLFNRNIMAFRWGVRLSFFSSCLCLLLLSGYTRHLLADDIDIYFDGGQVDSDVAKQSVLLVDLSEPLQRSWVQTALEGVLEHRSTNARMGLAFVQEGRYVMAAPVQAVQPGEAGDQQGLTYWVEQLGALDGQENIDALFNDAPTATSISLLSPFQEAGLKRASQCVTSQVIVITARQDVEISSKRYVVHKIVVQNDGQSQGHDVATVGVHRKLGETYSVMVRDARQLEQSVSALVRSVSERGGVLSAPTVAGQPFANVQHLDHLYFSLFKPSEQLFWPGNVKRYRLDEAAGEPFGREGVLAMIKGEFNAKVQDEWARSSPYLLDDQSGLLHGGVASQLRVGRDPVCGLSDRQLYTFTGDYAPEKRRGWASVPKYQREADLTRSEHCLKTDAVTLSRITALIDRIGGDSDGKERQKKSTEHNSEYHIYSEKSIKRAVKWATGVDYFDAHSDSGALVRQMGSVIHSQPVLVDYGGDSTLFVSSNQGYLHAINAANGEELFAFLPQELLYRLPQLYSNPVTSPQHPDFYGLDGRWVVWRQDALAYNQGVFEADGVIDRKKNKDDHVYIYGGMRRGGSNYYALDVTEASSKAGALVRPRLKFVIRGGLLAGDNSPYRYMGQTWSEPVLGRVKIGNQVREVLFVGGGFDPQAYEKHYSTKDVQRGHQIYMLDAQSGELLWWASDLESGADLQSALFSHSITARIKALDLNGDGLVDRLYAVDLGGHILRLDISDQAASGHGFKRRHRKTFARVRRVAALGGTGADDRRFYHAPSVTFLRDDAGASVLAIAVASGDRTEPKSTYVNEYLFLIFDDAAAKGGELHFSDLDQYEVAMKASGGVPLKVGRRGWRMPFGQLVGSAGEKSMGSPVFFKGRLFFTTYIPSEMSEGAKACSAGIGRSRLYIVDGLTGSASLAFINRPKEKVDPAGRFLDAVSSGIVGEIQLLFGDDTIRLLAGTAMFDVGKGKALDIDLEEKTVRTKGWLRVR